MAGCCFYRKRSYGQFYLTECKPFSIQFIEWFNLLQVCRQRIQKRPLLVAQMVEEWFNHYRRLGYVLHKNQSISVFTLHFIDQLINVQNILIQQPNDYSSIHEAIHNELLFQWVRVSLKNSLYHFAYFIINYLINHFLMKF